MSPPAGVITDRGLLAARADHHHHDRAAHGQGHHRAAGTPSDRLPGAPARAAAARQPPWSASSGTEVPIAYLDYSAMVKLMAEEACSEPGPVWSRDHVAGKRVGRYRVGLVGNKDDISRCKEIRDCAAKRPTTGIPIDRICALPA